MNFLKRALYSCFLLAMIQELHTKPSGGYYSAMHKRHNKTTFGFAGQKTLEQLLVLEKIAQILSSDGAKQAFGFKTGTDQIVTTSPTPAAGDLSINGTFKIVGNNIEIVVADIATDITTTGAVTINVPSNGDVLLNGVSYVADQVSNLTVTKTNTANSFSISGALSVTAAASGMNNYVNIPESRTLQVEGAITFDGNNAQQTSTSNVGYVYNAGTISATGDITMSNHTGADTTGKAGIENRGTIESTGGNIVMNYNKGGSAANASGAGVGGSGDTGASGGAITASGSITMNNNTGGSATYGSGAGIGGGGGSNSTDGAGSAITASSGNIIMSNNAGGSASSPASGSGAGVGGGGAGGGGAGAGGGGGAITASSGNIIMNNNIGGSASGSGAGVGGGGAGGGGEGGRGGAITASGSITINNNTGGVASSAGAGVGRGGGIAGGAFSSAVKADGNIIITIETSVIRKNVNMASIAIKNIALVNKPFNTFTITILSDSYGSSGGNYLAMQTAHESVVALNAANQS